MAVVNAANIAVEEVETQLAELSERMLLGVAFKFGKNSNEYAMAGGTRRKDRKRPTRRSEKSNNAGSSAS